MQSLNQIDVIEAFFSEMTIASHALFQKYSIKFSHRNTQKNPHSLSHQIIRQKKSTLLEIISIFVIISISFFCFIFSHILARSLRMFWHLLRHYHSTVHPPSSGPRLTSPSINRPSWTGKVHSIISSKIYTFYSGKKTRKPTNNVVKRLVSYFALRLFCAYACFHTSFVFFFFFVL